MKKRYRFCIVLVVTIVALFVGLAVFATLGAYGNYLNDKNTIYVVFSKDGEDGEPIDYREIADYQSIYSNYNSRILYDTLSPSEQQIYRFFEYALDNEYTEMFFDSRLLKNVDLSLDEILKIYSIDSPMVQQNFTISSQKTSYTFSYLAELLSFEIDGSCFVVNNFSSEAMEKKKEAVLAAEAVFQEMPKDLNQLEQARFFFRYLTREVTYTLNEAEPEKQNNLYDAFIEKKTQCDGFANAFSLLCGMAKIPCMEKVYTPEEKDAIGHTWNIFCADGVWYNADLAISEEYVELHKEFDMDFSFGFSDEKSEYVSDYSQRFPVCTSDLYPVTFYVTSPSDPNLLSGLRKAFQNTSKNFVYFCLEKGELSQKDLQRIANYLNSDIKTIDETRGGKTFYYIFKI